MQAAECAAAPYAAVAGHAVVRDEEQLAMLLAPAELTASPSSQIAEREIAAELPESLAWQEEVRS